MKLHTDAVYDLRMCMKEDNPNSKYFKGDNLRETIRSAGQGYYP